MTNVFSKVSGCQNDTSFLTRMYVCTFKVGMHLLNDILYIGTYYVNLYLLRINKTDNLK